MQLALDPIERDLLIRVLERAIAETRVEVRRTRGPTMHDALIDEEDRLKTMLAQLRKLAA